MSVVNISSGSDALAFPNFPQVQKRKIPLPWYSSHGNDSTRPVKPAGRCTWFVFRKADELLFEYFVHPTR